MTPGALDHLLVFVLAVVLPLEGYSEVRFLLHALSRGVPHARARIYLHTIALQWLLVAALFAGWHTAGRPWGALGLAPSAPLGTGVGLGALALTVVLVVAQLRGVHALTPERRERLIRRTGPSINFLPSNQGERALFGATSVTAGVCEELLCRGFFLWYLGHWLGPWPAAGVSSVAFGVAHVYQGPKGVVRTGLVGFAMAALYITTGSILWPILAHAAIDLGAGALSKVLFPPGSAPVARGGVSPAH